MNGAAEVRRYEVFDLAIDPPRDGLHPIRVVDSPNGQAFELVDLPFTTLELRAGVAAVEEAALNPSYQHADRDAPRALAARQFGAALFEALFQGSVARAYVDSRATVRERGNALRVQFRVRDEALVSVPWEALFDAEVGSYVGLEPDVSITRFPERLGAPRPFEVEGPIRVLGVMVEDASIDAPRERRLVDAALDEVDGGLEVVWLENPNWRELTHRLQDEPWHVFHYIGHARPGFVTVDDDQGSEPREMAAADLAAALGDKPSLRLAVINGCETARGQRGDSLASTAAAIAEADVSAVVAQQYKIFDAAAIELSREFYRAIAQRHSVDEALARARSAVNGATEFTLQWLVPVLYMRAANGSLFAGRSDPESVAALAAEGRMLFRREEWGRALQIFEELAELEPGNASWPCWRGLVRTELGDHGEGRRDLEQSVPALTASLGERTDFETVALRGMARARLGLCVDALDDLDAATGAGVAGVAEHLAKARCRAGVGRPKLAVADYTHVLGLDPDRTDALVERALLLAADDRRDQAIADLDRAVELRPGQLTYRRARAEVYAADGRYDLATRDLDLVIEDQPADPELYLQRGRLRYDVAYFGQTHDYRPAIEDFGQAIDLSPDRAESWYLRGRAYLQMASETRDSESVAAAAHDLAQATERDETNCRYRLYHGKALREQGDRRQARQAFERAIALGCAEARDELSFWDRLFRR